MEELYGILEAHAFGVRDVNEWHNYVWERVTELDGERLLDFWIKTEGELAPDNVKIIYISKLN